MMQPDQRMLGRDIAAVITEGSRDDPFVRPNLMLFLPHLLGAIAALATLVIEDPMRAFSWTGAISVVFAMVVAIRRGGPYLIPSSVFLFASGVFVGLASYYLARGNAVSAPEDLRRAAFLALITTIATSVVATCLSVRWRLTWPTAQPKHVALSQFRAPRHFEAKAVALIVVSQVGPLPQISSPVATATGLGGVVMIVLSAATRRHRIRWIGDLFLVSMVVVVPFGWTELNFEGGGRLTVAGLGVAAFVAWNLARPHGLQKVAVVMCLPLILIVAGTNRLEKDERRGEIGSSSQVVTSGEGLESLYSPLDTWAEILSDQPTQSGQAVGSRYGATFLNTLALPIPRSIWEHKPKGFGAELTEVLRPDLVVVDHSMAALIQGEWYANFGFLGLVMMPLPMGWFLAALDRSHYRLAVGKLAKPYDWWSATILLCLLSSLGDLYWVGTFTFFSRGGMAAIVVWIVSKASLRPTPVTWTDTHPIPLDAHPTPLDVDT